MSGRLVSPNVLALDIAAQKIAAIRELHTPAPEWYGGANPPSCNVCGTADEYPVAWPCQTIRILNGEVD